MCTRITSPGFISRVWRFGVNVARSLSCGLGGPAGTPLFGMKPKLTGSVQFGLHGPEPLPVHSRLSMVRAEHQCVLSQLMLSDERRESGRVELQFHEGRPGARIVALRRIGV